MVSGIGSRGVLSEVDEDEVPGYVELLPLNLSSFATTYRAKRGIDGAMVVVKVLTSRLTEDSTRRGLGQELEAARLLAGQAHMLHVVDAGATRAGRPYVVTAHCQFGSLGDELSRSGPLPVDMVINVAVPVARVLGAAHRLELYHGGVKPNNILLDSDGVPMLSDFVSSGMRARHLASSPTQHTAPEVLHGLAPTARSDVFSLGATLQHLLTGQIPHSDHDTAFAQPADRDLSVTEPIRSMLARAMAVEPSSRYPHALAFAEHLEKVLGRDLAPTRPRAAATPQSTRLNSPVPVVPGYTDLELIGEGRLGVVYRAWSERLQRRVAIKVFTIEFTDAALQQAFHEEMLLTSRVVDQPNVVAALDWGTTGASEAYLAMDYCPGGSLHQMQGRRGPLPVEEVLDIGARLAEGLAAVHGHGLLHGDIRPHNILLGPNGEPALADLGVALLTSWSSVGHASPAHTAPEVLRGDQPTRTSDVYSLGATLYHLLAGQPPYSDDGAGVVGLLRRIHSGEEPLLARPDAAPLVVAAIRKAMASQPADRYPDAATLALTLQRLELNLSRPADEFVYTPPPEEESPSHPRPAGWDHALSVTGDNGNDDLISDRWPLRPPTRRRRWPVAAIVAILVAAAIPALLVQTKADPDAAAARPALHTPAPTTIATFEPPPTTPPATPPPTVSTPSTPMPYMSMTAPSGQRMPVGNLPGWRQVLAEDFTSDAALGSFPGSAYSQTWRAFYDGSADSSKKGQFSASRVVSVDDGLLSARVHTENGIPLGAAILPSVQGSIDGQLYARYTIRIRADSVPGYRTALVLWPDSQRWPLDGHVEFPAGNLTKGIHAWLGYASPLGGGEGFNTSATFRSWHTATIEWLPGRVRYILDGKVVGLTVTKVPDTPLHLVLQTETCFDACGAAGSRSGTVQVDWVSIYARA